MSSNPTVGQLHFINDCICKVINIIFKWAVFKKNFYQSEKLAVCKLLVFCNKYAFTYYICIHRKKIDRQQYLNSRPKDQKVEDKTTTLWCVLKLNATLFQ